MAGLTLLGGGVLVLGIFAVLQRGQASPSTGLAVLHTPDYHSLALSPADPNVVFFGHHNGVMRSDNGGRTFHAVVSRQNFDAMSMAINPQNGQQIFMAGHDVFQASFDGGASWQPMTTNLPGTDIHGLAMNPDNPARLTAFVVGFGLLTSTDAGRTWKRLGGRIPGDVMSLSSAGGSPETLYATSMSSGVLRSTDGGQSFTPIAPALGRMVYSLMVDPTTRTTVYAGVEGGLYKSSDGGTSWTKLPYPGSNATVVGISGAQPNELLAINVQGNAGIVERSDDGGLTWNKQH